MEEIIMASKIIVPKLGDKLIHITPYISFPIHNISILFKKEIMVNKFRLIYKNDPITEYECCSLSVKFNYPNLQPSSSHIRNIQQSINTSFIDKNTKDLYLEFEHPITNNIKIILNGYKVVVIDDQKITPKFIQ